MRDQDIAGIISTQRQAVLNVRAKIRVHLLENIDLLERLVINFLESNDLKDKQTDSLKVNNGDRIRTLIEDSIKAPLRRQMGVLNGIDKSLLVAEQQLKQHSVSSGNSRKENPCQS